MFFYNENTLTDTLDWLTAVNSKNNKSSNSHTYSYAKHFPRRDGTSLVEVENGYVFKMAVPGCGSDDVSVKFRENKITIHAVSTVEHFEDEIDYTLKVTDKIDWKKIEAKVKNGILTLELPFAKEFDKSRTIL